LSRTLLLLLLLALPPAAPAAEPVLFQPRWSLDVKGGVFAPKLAEFEQYYGKGTMPHFAASLAYKLWPQVELGAGAGMGSAEGGAYAAYHGTLAGRVTYELYPVDVFILGRLVLMEEQRLIPYAGAGWTRVYYRQTVRDQGEVGGSADGYHVRGGLQISLNEFDQIAASRMYSSYGVMRTSFILEAEYTSAVERSASINLGGAAYRGGLLFEF
jgi:hypothetical protein